MPNTGRPLRLTLEFKDKPALQLFLDHHTIGDGTVSCDPPIEDDLPTPPIAAIAIESGVFDTDTWRFNISGTADPEEGLQSVTIAWGDSSSDTTVSLSGGALAETIIEHEWPTGADATYTITLTVVNTAGQTGTATVTVDVDVIENPANQNPIAVLAFVSGEFTGSPVVLNTVGSTDPDGTIADWEMDWDDGPPDTGSGDPDDPVQHTYATPGTYHAVLTVTDNLGATGTAALDLIVSAPAAGDPPDTEFSLTDGEILGDDFSFLLDGSDPDAGAITWVLDFGDGSPNEEGTTLPTTRSRRYASAGTFIAVFRVTDTENLTTTKTIAVTVLPSPEPVPENQSPIPKLTFISGVFINQPVVLSTEGTVDLDGNIASYSIDWDDGTPAPAISGAPPVQLTHQYSTANTYVPVLTVTDNGSPAKSGTASLTITVVAPEPPPPPQPPVTSLSLLSGAILGDSFVFSLTGTDPEGGALTWTLNFGDGSALATGTGAQLPTTRARTYATAGNKTVTFKVTDTTNLTTTKTLSVSVVAVSPPPSGGTHAYFEALSARSDRFRAHAWRTQAEIDQFDAQVQNPQTIVYDPVEDAAKMITPAAPPGGIPNGPITELVSRMGPNNQQNIFIVGDFQWDVAWTFADAGIAAHKGAPWAFCSPAESLWVATRTSYLLAQQHVSTQPAGGPFVAFTWAQGAASEAIKTSLEDPASPWWVGDMAGFPLVKLPDTDLPHSRKYGEAVAPVIHNATFPGGTELGIVANRWTRFFHYFERAPKEDWICNRGLFAGQNKQMTAYRWSYWIADTVRDAIQMIDGALVSPHPNSPNGWVGLKTEFQGGAGTPNVSPVPLYIWTRNWVVLHGTALADVTANLLVKPV